jgi:hypothetical protein
MRIYRADERPEAVLEAHKERIDWLKSRVILGVEAYECDLWDALQKALAERDILKETLFAALANIDIKDWPAGFDIVLWENSKTAEVIRKPKESHG